MKKRPGFSVLFTSILMVLFAVSATWAAELTLQGTAGNYYINMPESGSHTLTIPEGVTEFHVYDNGGAGGTEDDCDYECEEQNADAEYNYHNAMDAEEPLEAYLTIEGSLPLQVAGSVNTEYYYDLLKIYDGGKNATPLWEQSSATQTISGLSTSGNKLTLYFKADDSNNKSGFDLTISSVDPSLLLDVTIATSTNGSIASSVSKALSGNTVVLTATPSSGYYLESVVVVDADGHAVDVSGTGNTRSFVMPEKEVTVAPNFASMPLISVATAINGSIVSDVDAAIPGATVTLTVAPSVGYYFAGVSVVDEDDNSVIVSGSDNTVTFEMPEKNVTVTATFAQISYGAAGCLANGAYFHLHCTGYVCTISQRGAVTRDPDADFSCWSDLVAKIEEITENAYSNGIILGSDLELGGFDGESENCVMQDFRPIRTASFDGQNHTINGFCQVSSDSAGFLSMYQYLSTDYFKNVRFTNAYVVGDSAGVLASSIKDEVIIENVVVDGANVTGVTAGGLAGYIHYHSQYGYTSMLTEVSVKNSTIVARNISAADSIQAGALFGKGAARQSRMIGKISTSTNNTVKAVDADGAVVSLGGAFGVLLSCDWDDNHKYLTLQDFAISGATLQNLSTVTESNIGGFAGLFIEGIANAKDSLEQISFNGTISGGTNVGGLVGKIDIPSIRQLYIRNTYSTGEIAGTGNVGYIVGSAGQIDEIKMYNNYHVGTDVITRGIGNYANWNIGSDNIYANVRNATGALSYTGDMNHYEYRNGTANYMLYFPIESVDNIVRNGVANEDDMNTNMFAALMNKNATMFGGERYAMWSRDESGEINSGYPIFSSSQYGPYYVISIDLEDSWGLDDDQVSALGAIDGVVTIGNDVVYSKTMVEYLHSGSYVSNSFVNNVARLRSEVAGDNMLADGNGSIIDNLASVRFSSSQKLQLKGVESYNVVYNYCTSATVCNSFESLTDRLFVFLSPKLDVLTTNDAVSNQIIPYVISVGATTPQLKITTVKVYDDGNNVIQTFGDENGYARLWETTEITAFLRQTTSTVSRIEVNYRDYSSSVDVPEISVYATDAEIKVHGVDNDGESHVAFTMSDSYGYFPYGRVTVSYNGSREDRVGYTSNGASLTYSRTIADGGEDNVPGTVNDTLTGKTFGSVESVYDKLISESGVISLTLKELEEGDTVDINVLRLASAQASSYFSAESDFYLQEENLTIGSSYSPIDYNVTFDFNAPKVNDEDILPKYQKKWSSDTYYDGGVFLGSDYQNSATVNVEKKLPRIYTTICPSVVGWQENTDGIISYDLKELLEDANSSIGNGSTLSAQWVTGNSCTPSSTETKQIKFAKIVNDEKVEAETWFDFPIKLELTQQVSDGVYIGHRMKYGESRALIPLAIPDVNDTLVFNVSGTIRGYGYSDFGFEAVVDETQTETIKRTNETGSEVLGYTEESGTYNKTLVVNPKLYRSMLFYAKFWLKDYYVTFNNIFPDLEDSSFVYLGNALLRAPYSTEDKYNVEGGNRLPIAHTIKCPVMKGWKPQSDAENYSFSFVDLIDDLTFGEEIFTSVYAEWDMSEDCVAPSEDDLIPLQFARKVGDDENATLETAVTKEDFPLQVTLRQTKPNAHYDSEAGEYVPLVIDHPMVRYEESDVNPGTNLISRAVLPKADDTLTFKVMVKPQKGYAVNEFGFNSTADESANISETRVEGVTLGYSTADDDTILAVNTKMLSSMKFWAKFTKLQYNVTFDFNFPDTLSEKYFIYVGNSWRTSMEADIESNLPRVYTTRCPVMTGWKASTNVSYVMTDVFDDIQTAADEDNKVTLSGNWDVSGYCNPPTAAELLALNFAKISDEEGADPVIATDRKDFPVQVTLRQMVGEDDYIDHPIRYLEAEENGSTTYLIEPTNLPKVDDTLSFSVSVKPLAGYTLDQFEFHQEVESTVDEDDYTLGDSIGDDDTTLTMNPSLLSALQFNARTTALDYTVAFDTTKWDSIYYVWSPSRADFFEDSDYQFFVPSDIDAPEGAYNAYNLNNNSADLKLPLLYAVTAARDGLVSNARNAFAVLWTPSPDSAHCEPDAWIRVNGFNEDKCVSEAYDSFSSTLIEDAAARGLIGEGRKITLYPVWKGIEQSGSWLNAISCENSDPACEHPEDDPITIELTQSLEMGGETYEFKHSTVDKRIKLPQNTGHNFVFDIAFKVNPGYTVAAPASGTFDDPMVSNFSYADGKFYLDDADYFMPYQITYLAPEYGYVDYNVTFHFDDESDYLVVLGNSFGVTKQMNIGAEGRVFPATYALKRLPIGAEFWPLYWSYKPQDQFYFVGYDYEDDVDADEKVFFKEVAYSSLTSSLLRSALGENSEVTDVTVYPMNPMNDDEDYTNASSIDAENIPVYAVNGEEEILTEAEDYHGSVLLSQQVAGVPTFVQTSELVQVNNKFNHVLYIPKDIDDTLTFNVSIKPDVGYEMQLKGFDSKWINVDGDELDTPEDMGEVADNVVKINPKYMDGTMKFMVQFTQQHYNLTFAGLQGDVFVANKLVGDDYQIDWLDKQSGVTAENIVAPLLYNASGSVACRIDWKVADSEEHENEGIVNELAYMTSTEKTAGFVNELIPDIEHPDCDSFSTITQMLTVEGQGTLLFEQVLDVTPENEGDPTQIVVKHPFVEDESSGEISLRVPSIHRYNENGNWRRAGVKFRVVAVPAEGYTFDGKNAITYERDSDGNHETIVVEDSSLVNVMWPLSWKVKFTSLAPIYVSYDLSMETADDSANTYLPTNAKKSEVLELASNEDVVPFWTPYRTDLCFEGWSTKSMTNRDANDPLYKEFNADNFVDFSTNSDNPTTLYAIWGANCSAEHNWMYVINGNNKTTLTLYQLFGSDTLFHEVSNRYGLSLDGKAFDLYVDPARSTPNEGYHYVEDAAYGLSYTVEESAPVTVAADQETGVWHLSTETIEGEPTYTFDIATEMTDYTLVFDVNADDATVFYGTDWVKEKTLNLASTATEFPVYQRRTDACFDGWAFASHMAAESFRSFGSDFLDAVKSIMPTIETVLNDEGEEEDRTVYRLYAQWDESCEPQNYTVSTEIPAAQGSFRIVQVVDGQSTVLTLDGDNSLVVPKDHYVEYDTVLFVPATGYTLAADAEVSIVYSREDENFGVHTFANGSRHNFNDSTGLGLTTASLEISGLNADAYELVFVDNTGEAEDKPFLGDSWADFLAEGTLTEDESGNWMLKVGYNASSENKGFPIALYRNGQCLAGYTFAAGDNTDGVYKELSDAFLLKLAELENPVTLYPYWEDCENVYTVTASDAEQGVLTLTQKFVKGETEYVRNYIVEDGGIALSSTNDVTFKGVSFAPNEGSNLVLDAERAYSYRADAETEWADLAVPFTVTSDMEIKAPLLLQAEFALDAGYDDVFYGPGFSWNWSSDGVAFGAALPTNLYRAGYKLAGWKFDNEETPMLNLNEDFAAAYSAYAESHGGDYPDTLHAVWTVSGVIPAYSLQLTEETLDQNAGVLTLSQTIGDSTIVHVFEDGMLDVPMVEDLALTVNFAIDTAHSFDGETPITLKSYFTEDTFGSYATGDELVVQTEVLGEAGTVMVNVATKVDSYEFAFDINVGEDDQVFYGKDWFASKSYDMSEEELDSRFPASAYQTQNCLGGFAFTAMEPLEDGYTITMPDVKFYTGIDSAFIADYKALEEKPTTLYAVWLKPGVHCSAITSNVMISALNASEEGEFTLTNADMEIKLPASEETAAVQVPVADDLEFTVTFTPTSAYDFDAETGTITISLVDGYDYTLVNAKTYSFAKNATLKATPTLKAVAFDLNANAGEASVFYGKEYAKTWTSTGVAYGDVLPKNIYRADAKFVGWAFAALEDNATEGFFTKFDKDFMDAYAAQETAPTTLYAVWKTDDERATYKIASASTDAGDLLVAQFVGEDSLGYAVTAAGLTVPAESDLEFKAYFTVNMEHTLASVSQPLTLMNADEEETPFGTIANGDAFTLQGNTSIVANTSDDAYEFVFDVNAGDATVFYGTNWVENLVVEMTDATASRDFPTSIYRTDKCLQGFSFDSENQETYYEGITEEFVKAFKDGGYSSPKTLYAVWGDCPDDHKNVSVTVANTAAEGWFSLGNYVGDIENEFDLDEDHESLLVPVADDLEFTVSFVSGGAYTFNGVINVLDADAETPTLVKELHSTNSYTFKQNVKLQAVTEFVKVELVFDLNVDDANVFFTSDFDGLTWNVNDYGDEFPSKIVRADKVFAGWGFTRDAAEGFTAYDNDFVIAYNEFSDSHDLTNAPITLYALWIDAPEAIETYHISLQNSYDGKLTLSQSNAGVVTEYEVGADGIDIPVNANREFRVTFDADYAYSLAAGTPITISEISSMGNVTGETSIANGGVFEFDANSVISVEMGADKYILAFDANKAANDTVFYGTEWSATKSYDLAEEGHSREFPTAYQTSKCLAGFAFSKTATESEAFQEVGVDFIKAYKALEVKPTTLYAVWTTEDCNHGYVVLRSGNTEAEGSFTISDAVNSYELSAGSLMAVPNHVLSFMVSFHEGRTYELKNIDVFSDDQTSNYSIANETECRFDENTILKANVEPKSKGLVFALNADGATVFYGTSYDPYLFENFVNGEFYAENLPSAIYRTDAEFMGWSFTQLNGVAEGSKYFTKIDDDFYEAFKNHAETRENFDTPDTLYAVWKSAPNREIYTVTVGNKASEGKFRLTNASGGLSNEFLVDATTMLVIPAENDLVFTVSFVSASETAEYEGISVISTTGTQIAVIEMGDEYTFRKDVMLRAISYMPTMEFALDVNAGDADVFYESDFGFRWWASSYGQYLPTGIYRTDAKLVGWSLDKNATPDKAFKEIDDAFNEAVESYMEHYGEDLIGDVSEGDFDLSKIQEMYGMDFAQMSRGPVLYAVWEKANVKTVSVKSNSLRQGTLTLQQLVDDSTFTFVVGEEGLKVPYVEGGLEFRAHFEANESHLLNSGKSLVWNAAAADTTKNDEFVLVSEATSFDALVKVVGFNLAFNAESKETLFYGDDWTSGKKVIAKGTSASQFPTMVYSASRCLVGWTLKNDVVAYTEMQDELANKLYEKYPKLTDTTKINMYALWSDSPDQCSALMTRVSVEQDKGEVMLVEKTGESNEVVHKFNEKGSMMLPSDIVSAEWTLRSAPDSSYALDSLTIVRNDKLLAVLREGGNLPGNMDNAVFKAHFSKANKTPVEIVERHFAQSGNAIQLNIKASEFEVTRGVEARVRVFDVKDDSVVLDSLLGDSVAMGFESEVVLRMKRTGDYKVVLTLEDEKESDAFEQEFGVKSSIASVGKDGWQMVSLAAVDTSAVNWTSDDQVFYWWDEFGNGGDYWQYKRYNRGDSVVATRGAWYSSLDSLPLVLKRDIEDDGEDAVWKLDSIHSGWNLVANTHGWEVSLFAGHADEEKDVNEESEISFYRYNSETADYEETKYLKPYEAVWAKVGKKKNWKVSAAPVFAKATELEPQPEKPEGGRMLPKRVLAKASTKDRWVLQAVLSDKNGKQDAWNILGAGNNPFSAEEPPESMGDHVNLSIVEGKRALAKSIKSASDEMEWTVALSASNDRVGYLTLVGIDDVNAFGYRVFVTVDGNTTEMKDGVPLQVLLKSNAKTATVRVAPAAKVVAQNSLKGLRSARLGGKLKVSFEATGLAGTNARVDLLDMKGHVMSTVNAKTLEGTNALVLDAPKSGLYMLRVRAGSQQQAAKVMVK